MKLSNLRKFLPEKNQWWNFIFVIAGAFIVSFYFDAKAVELNQTWTEQREVVIEKSRFVEDLSVLSFSRVYYAEVYYLNKSTGESREVIDKSLQEYMDAVVDWNKQNVRNSIFIDKYYGVEMKDEYNNDLLPKLVSLHSAVLAVRRGESVSDFNDVLEQAKNKVFVFNENLYKD